MTLACFLTPGRWVFRVRAPTYIVTVTLAYGYPLPSLFSPSFSGCSFGQRFRLEQCCFDELRDLMAKPHEDRGSLRVAKNATRNESRKPPTRPASTHPTPPPQSEKERALRGGSRLSCCVIGPRNHLRNLSEGVSRAIFNEDSEYAIGFL